MKKNTLKERPLFTYEDAFTFVGGVLDATKDKDPIRESQFQAEYQMRLLRDQQARDQMQTRDHEEVVNRFLHSLKSFAVAGLFLVAVIILFYFKSFN